MANNQVNIPQFAGTQQVLRRIQPTANQVLAFDADAHLTAIDSTALTGEVNLNGVQTLTNKTLTAPVITAPVVTGPAVTSTTKTDASLAAAFYGDRSALTLTPATTLDSAGNAVVANRGDLTLAAGKILGDGFYSGVYGKFISTTGNLTPPNAGRFSGVTGKADFGTLVLAVNSQCQGVWADLAGSPTGQLGEVNALRVTNSMGVNANALAYFNGNANFLFDISESSPNVIATAGTGANSAAVSTGGVAAQVLKVQVGGQTRYIPLFSSNA